MSTGFELNAEVRNTHGKSEARRMRHADRVPGVIYGAGKEPQSISLLHKDIFYALAQEAFHSHILDINLDGKAEKVVLKAVQRHVTKPMIKHVDFMRVNASEKLTMNIPLHYIGEAEAAGVKDGGVMSKLMTDIEVKCLPANLPEFLEIDVTGLAMDQSLHISDIKLPTGVEFAQHDLDEAHDHPVVSIHQPKVSKEDTEESAAPADAEAPAEGDAAAETKDDDKN